MIELQLKTKNTGIPFWIPHNTVQTIKKELIEKIVGDVNCAHPHASIQTKIYDFVVDCFNAIAECFAKMIGSKNTLAQMQIRMDLHKLVNSLENHLPAFLPQTISPIANSFFKRALELEPPNLVCNPSEKTFIFETLADNLIDLFIDTLDTLAKARRNPIPALSKKNIELIRETLAVKPKESTAPVPKPARSLFASFTSFFGL